MKFFYIISLGLAFIGNAQNIPLNVSTYTDETSEGIYCFDFDIETGEISSQKLVAKLTNTSFLSYSTNRKFLYAVS